METVDFLAIARNPLRSDADRLAAWDSDCVVFWWKAHSERGLPMTATPSEYRDRVYELVTTNNLPVGDPK